MEGGGDDDDGDDGGGWALLLLWRKIGILERRLERWK